MLDLALIFLLTSLTSVMAIWLYRKVSGWHGFNTILVGRIQSNSILNISPQQGFITLSPGYQKNNGSLYIKSRIGTIRSPCTIRSPWGW